MSVITAIPRRLRRPCKWLWYRVRCPILGVPDARSLEGWLTTVGDGVVVAGPFRGLRTPCESYCSSLLPKLLGTYELELFPFWTPERLGAFRTVVNIGCAEGMYIAGIALVLRRTGLPTPDFHGFDVQPAALELCRRMLDRNGLTGVALGTEGWEHVLETAVGPVLVICDIEGAEECELDPVRATGLRRAHIICEVHDAPGAPRRRELLTRRFAATHDVTAHAWKGREISDFPVISGLHVPDHVKRAALDEHRTKAWDWLSMVPRSAAVDDEKSGPP